MKLRNRAPTRTFLLMFIIVLVACKDETIRKVARASDDMAVTIGLAIDVKRGLGQTGAKLISNEEELVLTLGLKKVNDAVIAFHTRAQSISQIDPASKNQLLQLAGGITESVSDLNQQGVLGIKNPDAKAKVTAALAGLSAALATIQAALGGV